MAQPVPFKPTLQQVPSRDLEKQLEDAPLAHVDAVLATYDLLQKLHDSGILDVLRGAAGARDALLEQLASVLSMQESTQALRNLIVLGKALGAIDPGVLRGTLESVVNMAGEKTAGEPPSLWELSKRARGKDARRGLATALGILEALGRGTHSG